MSHLDNCLAYLDILPPAISGSGGHNATFRAACECVRFGLTDAEALAALRRYNARCSPPWSERELQHKLDSARRKATPGEKAGHFRKQTIKPRTAAQLAERTTRRRPTTPSRRGGTADDRRPLIPVHDRPYRTSAQYAEQAASTGSSIVRRPSPVVRWQGDFLDFMAECHPGPRLSIELVALWQSYHTWCARYDFAPMTAADFCEWLQTTYRIFRDTAKRLLVHPKD